MNNYQKALKDTDRLLDLSLTSFDFTNEKLVKETRGEMFKALKASNEAMADHERKGNQQEALKMDLNFQKLSNKIRDFDEMAAEHSGDPSAQEQFQFMTGEPKTQGGKALNEKGSIRLYRPDQKIMADTEQSEMDLGSYLRAVVDKPRTDAERTAIQNSVGSSGYSMPTTVAGELIDRLRAANPVIAAGARTISLDGLDSTKFIKINSDPDSVWHEELAEEDLDDPVFGSVTMAPKTILCLTEVSRELMQDAANIEEALSATFVGSINQAILDATFGTATTNGPTGLGTTVTQTEQYANGGSPDWSNFVNASKILHDNNVPEDGRSFMYAPDIWQTLALATDDNGRYQDAPSFIRNVPNFTSSGVPAGSGYAGDFSNVVYGFRLNITLTEYPGPSARKYATIWVAAARLDIAVFRPKALVRIEEAPAG